MHIVPTLGHHYPASTSIHIGKLSTHPSHKIAVHRGLFYCIKCGNYSTSRHLKKLSCECKARTPHGERTLAALARDQLPDKVNHWPQAPPGSHSSSSGFSSSEQIAMSQVAHKLDAAVVQPSQSSQAEPSVPVVAVRPVLHSMDDPEPDSQGQLFEGSDSD